MNQKIENQLNLALSLTEDERKKTDDLDTGYDAVNNRWELIVKYNGDIEAVRALGATVRVLEAGYALVNIGEGDIDRLAELPQIIYIEKPKKLFYQLDYSTAVSCIEAVWETGLSGRGTIVAVIDSGIDYAHPDFLRDDGKTRIIEIYDETTGTVYDAERINEALGMPFGRRADIVPVADTGGHGTHVAGIAAGNGRESGGRYRGVAYRADILVVKLGNDEYFSSARLMEAIDYVIRKAAGLNRPVAINLSFGNNYGAHDGTTLLETYISEAALRWKTVIAAGSGNEANKRVHVSGILTNREVMEQFVIGPFELSIDLQLWKSYSDDFFVTLRAPDGTTAGPIKGDNDVIKYRLNGTDIYVFYGEPAPYSATQEIFIQFIGGNGYIQEGIWQIELAPVKIRNGLYDMWLPSGSFVSTETGFVTETADTTLTIPSTSANVISVGAYDARRMKYADFSGRGYTRAPVLVKPDIVAPGVGIMSAAAGGGYSSKSGTSMATPFVTGSAALLMEWGIVNGNDPYMYGEKIKAQLIKNARPFTGEEQPNNRAGWGALCLRIPG